MRGTPKVCRIVAIWIMVGCFGQHFLPVVGFSVLGFWALGCRVSRLSASGFRALGLEV